MINTLAIAGNLTKDPEIRGNQGKIIAFSIAYNERYKDSSGNWQENVSYFNVVKFATENYCSYLANNLKKGMKVTVTGKLNQNKWESNGQTNYDIQIIARDIDFFHVQNRQQGQGQGQGQGQNAGYQNNNNNNMNTQGNDQDFSTDSYYDRREGEGEGEGGGDNFGSIYSEKNNVEMDRY